MFPIKIVNKRKGFFLKKRLSIFFTQNSVVKDDERKYLRPLPAHIKLELQLNNDKLNLVVVHDREGSMNIYSRPGMKKASCESCVMRMAHVSFAF